MAPVPKTEPKKKEENEALKALSAEFRKPFAADIDAVAAKGETLIRLERDLLGEKYDHKTKGSLYFEGKYDKHPIAEADKAKLIEAAKEYGKARHELIMKVDDFSDNFPKSDMAKNYLNAELEKKLAALPKEERTEDNSSRLLGEIDTSFFLFDMKTIRADAYHAADTKVVAKLTKEDKELTSSTRKQFETELTKLTEEVKKLRKGEHDSYSFTDKDRKTLEPKGKALVETITEELKKKNLSEGHIKFIIGKLEEDITPDTGGIRYLNKLEVLKKPVTPIVPGIPGILPPLKFLEERHPPIQVAPPPRKLEASLQQFKDSIAANPPGKDTLPANTADIPMPGTGFKRG